MTEHEDKRVVLGRVSGLFGVRGWIKVFSGTEPREAILEYGDWQLHVRDEWRDVKIETGQRHGKNVIAKLAGIDDRDAAAALMDAEIAIWRRELPETEAGEVYWADLEGLQVRTEAGVELGAVDHLLETGANDVLVVKGERERLVPFIRGQVVKQIDLEQGVLVVDWDPDF
ncbi:MAG TPA: ribosome maturation factor RimM [Gammaproteobacteria bacterium]